MIRLTKKIDGLHAFDATLSLPIEIRVRSRVHVTLDDGREAGLFLKRGATLRHGEILSSEQGVLVKVLAAKESVSTLYCDDILQIAKAAYHLGNRHVSLQIEKGWLRYQQDTVLDEMLQQMGLNVISEQATFEPEPGAYRLHVQPKN